MHVTASRSEYWCPNDATFCSNVTHALVILREERRTKHNNLSLRKGDSWCQSHATGYGQPELNTIVIGWLLWKCGNFSLLHENTILTQNGYPIIREPSIISSTFIGVMTVHITKISRNFCTLSWKKERAPEIWNHKFSAAFVFKAVCQSAMPFKRHRILKME
jgi:hypothetical protein